MNEPMDFKVVGDTTSQGGEYNNIKVTGDFEARSDLKSERMKVTGNVKVNGDLDSNVLRVTGNLKSNGVVEGKDVKIIGNLKAKVLKVRGYGRVYGDVDIEDNISGEQIDLKGSITCGGDLSATTMKVYGTFHIKEMANVEALDIKLIGWHRSIVKEMRGKTIRVTKAILRAPKKLSTHVMEFDYVDIDYVEADMVRGKSVRIGKHCKIGKIEYSNTLVIENGAIIGEREKIQV